MQLHLEFAFLTKIQDLFLLILIFVDPLIVDALKNPWTPKGPTSQIRVLSGVVHTETPRWKWFATAGPKTEFLVIF